MSLAKSLVLMTEESPKELPHYARPTCASIRKSKTGSPRPERPKTVRTRPPTAMELKLGSPKMQQPENKSSKIRQGVWNLFRKSSQESEKPASGEENQAHQGEPGDLKEKIFTAFAPKTPAKKEPCSVPIFDDYAYQNPEIIQVADNLARQAQLEIDQSENIYRGGPLHKLNKNEYFVPPEVLFRSVGDRTYIPVAEYLDLLHKYASLCSRLKHTGGSHVTGK
ncbi:hypothetical protein KL949_000465 [Ogataea haglerorum]|nr:hypothetical protein KL913_000301 [Ogataea haglerorum]KAG7723415.1 hypothetical protein KL949_000465 [Ogataea haglerorum]KAG7771961.1 hypothetical protein KL931_000301 [Ogataea haglerorum]KAG7791128.1 hypothetical protein KL945_000916 [Ogataea haglerorum]KAG7793604.1 hypothetical protein KL910_000299 [Ogataea haglerorum]